MNDIARNTPFEEIALKGAALYERIKPQYEPQENGKFLAIEPESSKTYLGSNTAEALDKARSENPGKLFYIVKIGFEASETLAHSLLGSA